MGGKIVISSRTNLSPALFSDGYFINTHSNVLMAINPEIIAIIPNINSFLRVFTSI
jgi:hypothetical protein